MLECKNILDSYLKIKKETDILYEKIYQDFITESIKILLWENENVGTQHDVAFNSHDYSYTIEFLEKYAVLEVDITWPFGGNEREYYNIPYEKYFSEEWKEVSLKNYKDIQQRKLEEKRLKEEKLLLKERKEYERLKAKFENL